MPSDQKQIAAFKGIANSIYLPMILKDYGSKSRDSLLLLTDSITEIYKHLGYNRFEEIIIFVTIGNSSSLTQLKGVSNKSVISYNNLTGLKGKSIVIEVGKDRNLRYALNHNYNIDINRKTAIIYRFYPKNQSEELFGKRDSKSLPVLPESDSYFAVQTYKSLEQALEDYGVKIAKHSECPFLRSAWVDVNSRLVFSSKPEHKLRDSLHQFLRSLRNAEARPEQVVDKSHPVDIKVTFHYAPHLALIEIKWLGVSVSDKRKTSNYTGRNAVKRVNSGAKQLADYLDSNSTMAPNNTSKGYLVIFDARRGKYKVAKKSSLAKELMKFEDDEILITPEYHKVRNDFAEPIRYFMQPIISQF